MCVICQLIYFKAEITTSVKLVDKNETPRNESDNNVELSPCSSFQKWRLGTSMKLWHGQSIRLNTFICYVGFN